MDHSSNLISEWVLWMSMRKFTGEVVVVVQGIDIPILEASPLLLALVHLKGLQLRPTCATQNI